MSRSPYSFPLSPRYISFVWHFALTYLLIPLLSVAIFSSVLLLFYISNFSPLMLDMLPPITISSINCCSLNMSTISSSHHKLKLYGITKLKSDFILLSDIRLGSKSLGGNCLAQLENTFAVNPYGAYSLFSNSSRNMRGVGILVKKSLSFSVIAEARDQEENILALHLSTAGREFILISIYGPNHTNVDFFNQLSNILKASPGVPIIIGGDWNCTYSCNKLCSNPDVCDMASLPNISHSKLVQKLCENFNLSDPYRCFYPNKRDFTFTPRSLSQKNRSRLDFFLVSDSAIPCATDCSISQNLQNHLFDHKAIHLSFTPAKSANKTPSIANFILNDPLIDIVVNLGVIECYLHHSVDLPFNLPRRALLQRVGTAKSSLRELGADSNILVPGSRSQADELARANRIAELFSIIDEFDINGLQTLAVDIEDDLFLEYLINCIRNDIISYQTFIAKTFNCSKDSIISKLNQCKNDSSFNPELMRSYETRLNELVDLELKNEVEKFKNFELLNSEKVTPYFVKMTKCAKSEASLSVITDDAGAVFASKTERDEYVVNYYEKLYSIPPSEPANLSGCIHSFLGQEILDHPLVKDSILTQAECKKLESPLTLYELDEAVKNANKKSAPGVDGLSGKFIQKFWPVLRKPLLRYSNCCFAKGSLSDSFRTASIRLIPKKGELGNIKNWRPISLLSNLYKIISRALNNRLMTTTDRITSRAQKGFTSSRYLQEVLINVIEFVSHCNIEKKDGVVIAIDYAKAFDTISIKFMSECYKFFGLGPVFINMLETVGNNRRAALLLENSELSRTFNLCTGRPQGDNLSPTQYNIGQQIPILRLELDPQFRSVFQHFLKPTFPFPLPYIESKRNEKFKNESARETTKVEGFADDTNGLGVRSKDNILAVKQILIDFSVFSGLHCNFDKTCVMPVGVNKTMDSDESCGLSVKNSITLLGMEIDNELAKLHDNFDITITKMEKVANYWNRFKLSLPGRIAIAKTFLLSLINHIGCIFMPLDHQLVIMQNITDKFCIGPLNISKDRLYTAPCRGGLGLIRIKDFLIAQHTIWIKRASTSSRDNWRVDLHSIGLGNPFIAHPLLAEKTHNPILHSLSSSFSLFNGAFGNLGCNFKKAYIMYNPTFQKSKVDKSVIDKSIFNSSANFFAIAKLRFCDFFAGSDLKSCHDLNREFSLNLNLSGYLRICGSLLHNKSRFKNCTGDCSKIEDFFNSFKKGSKSCRKILTKTEFDSHDLLKLNNVKTFFTLIGLAIPDRSTIKNFLGLWNFNFIPNKLRDFIFKFYHNKLGLNTRTSHFGGDTRNCTFCTISGKNPTDETFVHIFFECEPVSALHKCLERNLFSYHNVDILESKNLWFGCQVLEHDNAFLRIFFLTVQYFIWCAKLGKFLPNINFILGETVLLLDNACTVNLSFDACKNSINFPLSRHWGNIVRLARQW